MITINNRLPTKPNRWKITHESDSSQEYITWEYADEPTVVGTPINKATLEGIQTDLMSETELVVAEYTVSSSISQIDFTNLDMVSDGSVYEIIYNGKGSSSSTANLRINDISTSSYHNSRGSGSPITTDSFYFTSSSAAGFTQAFLSYNDSQYRLIRFSASGTTLATDCGYLSESTALSKLSFIMDYGNFPTGTTIKIIKRR